MELIEKGATGIVSIHIAGSLSNMVNLARIAAEGHQRSAGQDRR